MSGPGPVHPCALRFDSRTDSWTSVDGRTISSAELAVDRDPMRVQRFATAHLRTPDIRVVTALEFDDGEG